MNIDKMSERELKAAVREARYVIKDLMKSRDELIKDIKDISVDYELLNESGIAATRFLREYV